jgi:hypothetical protein
LYHLAKSAGVEVSIKAPIVPTVPQQQTKSPNGDIGEIGDLREKEEKPLPTIPETVYQNLPDFLKQTTTKATSPEDKDLLLLGSLVAISACFKSSTTTKASD